MEMLLRQTEGGNAAEGKGFEDRAPALAAERACASGAAPLSARPCTRVGLTLPTPQAVPQRQQPTAAWEQ